MRAVQVIGVGLVAATLVAACGDDDDEPSASVEQTAAPDASSTSEPASDGSPTSVGGAAQPAEGEPLTLGYISLAGGVVSVEEYGLAAEAARQYVNAELGGIAGRPLELKTCDTDGTPERSIDCANQMVEAGVPAVVFGADPSSDATLPILSEAGVAMYGFSPSGPASGSDLANATFVAPFSGFALILPNAAKALGVQSIAVLVPDLGPQARAFVEQALAPSAQALGITVSSQFYDPAAPDWAALAASAIGSDPDLIAVPASPDGDCTNLVQAVRDAGSELPIWVGQCYQLLDSTEGANLYLARSRWDPRLVDAAPTAAQEEISTFQTWLAETGASEFVNSPTALASFGSIVDLARSLSGTDPEAISGSAILATLGALDGAPSFAGPPLNCSSRTVSSTCTESVVLYQTGADGDATVLFDGFVDPTTPLG